MVILRSQLMARKQKRGITKLNEYLVKNYSSGSILERAAYNKQPAKLVFNKLSIIEAKLFQRSYQAWLGDMVKKCIKKSVK